VGTTLVLRLVVQETIGDLTEILAAFPQIFMAKDREFHAEQERDWNGLGRATTNKSQD
jgi:antitoxin VapB